MEDEKVCRCALSYALCFKPKMALDLVSRFGGAGEVFKLSGSELAKLLGGNEELAAVILNKELLEWAKAEVSWCASKGVEVISIDNECYPSLLLECDDAPLVLYYKGSASLNGRNIAMVGTRMASGYGRESCHKIVEHLSKLSSPPAIVSGLAYGIDIASHKAALELGLDTIAVLPNGIDTIYPTAHRNIAGMIVKHGGIITEFPRGIPARKINFIKRNRIIAGISNAVIVVESRIKGGAMLTVEFANSYSRDVFAVPGRLGDTNSYGCNYLISKNIASLYYNELVVPQALGWEGSCDSHVSLQPNLFSDNVDEKEKILLSLNFNSPNTMDNIVTSTGFSFSDVAFMLLELELEGRVLQSNGGYCLR